jgi:hypothetical protein
MDSKKEESRLLRRIAHLHTMLQVTNDAEILLTVREFIAETETRITTLQRDRDRKATRH